MSVQGARDAAARGDWPEAFDLLSRAAAADPLEPPDLALLGEVAYAAGHLDAAIEAWERLHGDCVRAGDTATAAVAAVRVAMHLLFDTALMAPVRGWLARADRLLEGGDGTPAHAWSAAIRAYERILSGDLDGARPWARRAVEIGADCAPAACAIGRVAEARLLIFDGEVDQGLALLDEVGAASVSGDLDPLSTGVVYCELVCALQGLAQYDAAEEWTEAMERWCRASAVGSLHGRCRVHRAEILRLRGSCDEAEREAIAACEELRPYLRRELGWPLSELGRIRLRKGDLDGAEAALLEAHRAGWDAQPALALVHLARGDAKTAAAEIQDALENPSPVPSKELPPHTDLRRAPLLAAQVEIAVSAGDVARAHAAADELEGVASRFRSKALVATATLARARARLAAGEVAEASRLFSDAAARWTAVGAPYEAADARRGLADALRAAGRAQEANLELQAARAVVELAAPIEAGNAFRLEGDYWSVVYEGRTVRVRDLKGMRHLARLLAQPGHDVHVLELVGAATGAGSRLGLGDAGELLDERAKTAYRRRLAEIEEDIQQARVTEDVAREEQADTEREFLVRELARAVGLGGRDRRAASASERARAGVTRAIRQAIARLGEHDPALGQHLDRAVRTGTYCAYVPEPRAARAWRL
jgi:tetratricopeptide (TPR) repeat protein